MILSLYRYRWLLYELVLRDLVQRYRGSALGFFWTLLNPILFMGVYTLVFSVYLRVDMRHYPLFLVSGMVPWLWFAGSIQQGTGSIVDGRMYVGKAAFAPIVLIFVPILSNLVNFLLTLPFLIFLVLIYHVGVGAPLVTLPLLIAIQFLLTVAVLLFMATFNVFFRDLQQLTPIALMLLFYLIPIFYPFSAVPPAWHAVVLANPFAPIALAYQNLFYWNAWPDFNALGYSALVALGMFALGIALFTRYEEAFTEYL
jgi:ABC-type polysaccharide/polyol phosphate export permease